MYQGFLFDLDGTLVDSLTQVEHAWTLWGERHNLPAEEILSFIHGKQAITSLRYFLPTANEQLLKQEFAWLEQYEASNVEGISAMPGARALLHRLNEQQIPWAIVTSGSMPVAQARFRVLDLPRPEVFITAEQVSRGKPQPDPYLLGAQRLGIAAEHCVVVEDALAGIASGLAAGCTVVSLNAPEENSAVTLQLSSLEQLVVTRCGQGFSLEQTR